MAPTTTTRPPAGASGPERSRPALSRPDRLPGCVGTEIPSVGTGYRRKESLTGRRTLTRAGSRPLASWRTARGRHGVRPARARVDRAAWGPFQPSPAYGRICPARVEGSLGYPCAFQGLGPEGGDAAGAELAQWPLGIRRWVATHARRDRPPRRSRNRSGCLGADNVSPGISRASPPIWVTSNRRSADTNVPRRANKQIGLPWDFPQN